jgi:SAM-dependent MidA family methyltransferase
LEQPVRHNGGVERKPLMDELIREMISKNGPLTFATYMELALYHPELGYYRTRDPFGARGDFYTAEQLQPVFGEVMAGYIEQLARLPGTPHPLRVLELGAGRGEMREALKRWAYCAYDWNTGELPGSGTGLIFANEFFDALPVHLLIRHGGAWRELYVTKKQDRLRLTPEQISTEQLADYAGKYGQHIPDGGVMEACLAVRFWMNEAARILNAGYLLVIDYGYRCGELARFPQGSLTTYRKHQAGSDVLAAPGEQDITAHVNFTWLHDCAKASGFTLLKSCSLAAWLLSIWNEEELRQRWLEADRRWHLQWKQLLYGMGETFEVWLFRRDAAGTSRLDGPPETEKASDCSEA